jgi:hypothetical protein
VFKLLIRAALISIGASLSGAVLGMTGLWWLAILASVVAGFLGMSVGDEWLDHRRGSTTMAAIGGLVIVAAAGIVSLGSVEQRLWPKHASGLTLEQAHDDTWATSFSFQKARTRPELAGRASVLGRYGASVNDVSVVPVVEDGWTQSEPILVWAVAQRATRQERLRLWQQPLGQGVRVSGFYNSDYEKAVKDACQTHDLHAGREPLFIEWTTTPRASLLEAWRSLGQIALVSALALIILNVLVKIFQPRRRATR